MERLAGRYELGDALGQGRSTVYRAVDTRLRRDVAIKRVELLAGQEDVDRVRARALREAQASARLSTPHVVAVYDVVEQAGAVWLVMELVDAPSLAQVVADEGPMPHHRAATVGLGVLAALDAAHRVGVVHRDVKPANVLVRAGDRAALTDFGVATLRDESRVTATGLIVGSPSYMAPEQATGGEVTPATDLWALGALLYFATEGEPPFQAGNALATASAVVHGDPRPAERPGPLSTLLARLFTKDPAGRPSAAEVRATLSRVARTRTAPTRTAPAEPSLAPGPSPPPEPVERADATAVRPLSVPPAPALDRPARRSRRPLVAAAALGALALTVAVALVAARDDGDGTASGRSSATTEPAATDGSPPSSEATTTAPTTTTTDAPGLPAGWTPFTDPQGAYTLGLPPGWRVERTGSANRIDFVDPASGSFLRVEWTGTPGSDVAGTWRDLAASFRADNPGYEEIGIAPVAYRDFDAALWEFRHGTGETLHTGNLGFVTNGRGYALMLRTPESLWDDSQQLFEQFKTAFQPL